MADETPPVETPVPPYVAWKTFSTFIQYLAKHGVPSSVDRSTMANLSGSSQSQLLSALRFLSLVQGTGAPTQALYDLCKVEGPAFGQKLQSVILAAYRETLSGIDLKTTTNGELAKRFQNAGITGGTVATAISFLVSAAKEAKIELSPHVRPPRSPKRRSNGKKRSPVGEPADVVSQSERPKLTSDVQHFPIPLPQLGVEAGITLPLALDAASWQMIKTIIDAYADALIQRNTEDSEDDDE